MKKAFSFLLLAVVALTVFAQKGKTPLPKTPPRQLVVHWGDDLALQSSGVSAEVFRELMDKRLLPAESGWKVSGFNFSYAERGIFEDSVGNPILVVDYMTEFCPGDTLSKNIKTLLPDRIKRGDTAYLSNLKLVDSTGKLATGKPLRYIITR